MHLRLRDGLTFCFASDRAIFLDLPADRYFSLSPELDPAFRSWASGGEPPSDALDPLMRLGLFQRGETPERPTIASTTAPVSSLLELPGSKVGLPVGAACAHLVAVAARLRTGGLARTVAGLRRCKARHPSGAAEIGRIARIAHAHETAALVASSHDKCLPRSLALAWHLSRAGLACDLVLGVRLRPFHAHCWVQAGDVAINDRVDTVRTFTPILVA
jgi:hypothetical protein